VSTRGRQGLLEKAVVVYSNDPATPQLTLKIRATIEVLLGLDPDRVFLRQTLKGSKHQQTVKVTGKLAAQAKLLSVESSRPELKAALGVEAGQPVLKLEFQAPDKPERFSATVIAKTDQDAVKELKLFFSAEVTDDLVLSAPFVMFTTFDDQRPAVSTLVVRSLGGKPFKVTKVEDAAGAVKATVTPVGVEQQLQLTLTKQPATPRGSLKIWTDRADQPFLTAQYNVRAKGAPTAAPMPMVRGVPSIPGGPAPEKAVPGLQAAPVNKLQRAPLKLRTAPPPSLQPKDKPAPSP